jgi:type I restriction enzyme M protein
MPLTLQDLKSHLWNCAEILRGSAVDRTDWKAYILPLLFFKRICDVWDEKTAGAAKLFGDADPVDFPEVHRFNVPDGCHWRDVRETPANIGTALSRAMREIERANPDTLYRVFGAADWGNREMLTDAILKDLMEGLSEVPLGNTAVSSDILGDAYEYLIGKFADITKRKKAGEFYTPRSVVRMMVDILDPKEGESIYDPACGTGGFLVAAYEWLIAQTKGGALDREVAKRIRRGTYFGQDLVPRPRRLALMNLYLHGLEPTIRLGDTIYETPSSEKFDVVMTNPPFGTKGANQAPTREDFTVSTSNKQLNFVQHVLTILKPGGRCAIVLPDNCLFADQAGEVFKIVAEDCNLHTVLRLPRGTFTPYSQGVKANVVFFIKGYPTEVVWIYDARTNVPGITKKDRPLTPVHFAEFGKCYGADPNGGARRKAKDSKDDRWRSFDIAEVKERGFKLDSFKWLKEESLEDADDLPEPEELATDAISELEAAVEELNQVLALLENGNGEKK